jgi:hypothetical protein
MKVRCAVFLSSLSLCLAALLGASCSGVRTQQLRGTEFGTDENGRSKASTYVSPAEYERMTEAERARLNATVGVGVSKTLGKSSGTPRDLSSDELDRATKGGR